MEDHSPLKVVAIGGGTGMSSVLQGLKHYTRPADPTTPAVDITAIVTVTDDGGSSGRLRREFDVLPPGDIRNCMVALSEDSALLSRLFQYRFQSRPRTQGTQLRQSLSDGADADHGRFSGCGEGISEVLKIAGRIYPTTAANVALEATLDNGARVVGETRISRSKQRIRSIRLLPRKVRPLPAALTAIAEADVITFGPGSLFTSVIPNLLVEGIPAAIRSSPALKCYFVNLMSQPGETTAFSASDHVRAIHKHAGGKLIDYAVVNIRSIPRAAKKRYAREDALPVENDIEALIKLGLKVMAGNLAEHSDKVRHDSAATAAVLVKLAQEGRRRKNG